MLGAHPILSEVFTARELKSSAVRERYGEFLADLVVHGLAPRRTATKRGRRDRLTITEMGN